MSHPLPLFSFLFLLFNVIFCVLFFPTPTHQTTTALVAPVSKDKSTNLFILSVYLKTPLRPTKLYLDLGFYFSWVLCDGGNYNSSSFHHITCDPTFCESLGIGALSCANCTDFNPRPDPNCNPANLVCGSFPENPVIRDSIADVALIDTLALPSSTQAQLVLISNFTFSCSTTTLLKGLPKTVTGLASLGRSKLSLQAQISTALSTLNCVALCFPSSPNAPGVAFFGSTGPYYAFSTSKIDLSQSLIYTPLIVNPVAIGDTVITYRSGTPSNYYFIGLTSIQINGNSVPINASLLNINQDNGFGGTKISTSTPYTLLESSIHKAFTELFVKEAASSAFKLTVTTPVKPFNVCYPAGDLTVTSVGPAVPTVDLVLHARDVVWRILGANSMVRVRNKKKGVDLWCLGFVDGGVNKKTPIVIGGKQLEDNLIQFDLESNRLGFTSSLLSRSLSCADFNITTWNKSSAIIIQPLLILVL